MARSFSDQLVLQNKAIVSEGAEKMQLYGLGQGCANYGWGGGGGVKSGHAHSFT